MVRFYWPGIREVMYSLPRGSKSKSCSHSKSTFAPITLNRGPLQKNWHGHCRTIIMEHKRISFCIRHNRLCDPVSGSGSPPQNISQVIIFLLGGNPEKNSHWSRRIVFVTNTEGAVQIVERQFYYRHLPPSNRWSSSIRLRRQWFVSLLTSISEIGINNLTPCCLPYVRFPKPPLGFLSLSYGYI